MVKPQITSFPVAQDQEESVKTSAALQQTSYALKIGFTYAYRSLSRFNSQSAETEIHSSYKARSAALVAT